MEIAIVIKYFCWSFFLFWLSENIFVNTATVNGDLLSLMRDSNKEHYFIKKFKLNAESRQQAAASPQAFLELILGIVDTLQLGKRKIGIPS